LCGLALESASKRMQNPERVGDLIRLATPWCGPRLVGADDPARGRGFARLSVSDLTCAAARNARLVRAQGLTPADLGIDAAAHTLAFARTIVRLQAQHGLPVDGVAGPAVTALLTSTDA
jgi:murein L,D-transpeptidase YcbB/YkuD